RTSRDSLRSFARGAGRGAWGEGWWSLARQPVLIVGYKSLPARASGRSLDTPPGGGTRDERESGRCGSTHSPTPFAPSRRACAPYRRVARSRQERVHLRVLRALRGLLHLL